MTNNTKDPVRVLRESLEGVLKLPRGTSGRIILERSDEERLLVALTVTAAIPHSEQRETVAAGEARRSATDAEVAEWAERHDLTNILGGSARAAFEDAESLHMTFASPVAAPVPEAIAEDPRITAFYKLRDIAERDMDIESANIINAAIGKKCAAYKEKADPYYWQKHAVFGVNILGGPMREYAPGKWESAVWPSETKAEQPGGTSHDWPEDFSHENGNYQNKCNTCGMLFMGHKRRIICKTCVAPAVKHEASELPPLPNPLTYTQRGERYTAEQMYEFARMCLNNDRAALAAPPIAVQGSDLPDDLIGRLREYAGNPGYSHGDYADTMRQAADALESRSPVAAAPEVARKAAVWKRITAPGQVQVGDKLRFNIGDEKFNETVQQVLNPGTGSEELIYNKRKNYYVITKNAMTDFGSSKNVEFLSAAAPSADAKDSAHD